jgi:hypothetical protein
MGKTILINLFKTYLFAVIVSIAGLSIMHAINQAGNFTEAFPRICIAALFLNGIMVMMASPSMILSYPSMWEKPPIRLFLYFAGPLAFVLTVFTMRGLSSKDIAAYMMVAVIFFIVHAVFYSKLVKWRKSNV